MPYVINKGTHIHYEVAGEGEPLVMQHGFFSSVEDWHAYGPVDVLREVCQLVMIDGRGHGKSDKPYAPEAYGLDDRVGDITAVMDNLGLDKAHYMGYSMGGWIGFGMAKYAPARVEKLIIGGAQPYGRNFTGAREVLRSGMDAWIEEIQNWGPYTIDDLERYRKNDANALLAALGDRVDMSEVLDGMKMPCLFYAGEDDSEHDLIKGLEKEVEDGRFISFPGFNHIDAFVHGEVVVPRIIDFLFS
ncbi:MAG: alpha/beta hydrolase [Anaerolineae bacterium]|nr:alpha/beta hydrolase [Anaerolineae bacterium]